MKFNSPVSNAKVDKMIDIVGLSSASHAIDVGCGQGDFLIRLHQSSGAQCLGVDVESSSINEANNQLKHNSHGDKLEFLCSDIAELPIKPNSYDLAICMGASHAFADGSAAYGKALSGLCNLVKPNGMILIGEGYWKRSPDQEYLDFLGDPVGVYNSFEENITVAERLGLTPIFASRSTVDEWDDFEWGYRRKFELDAIAHANDEVMLQKLKNVRSWNANYRTFGRTTMGYAHYLFLNTVDAGGK
jgi:ubiquinone/menaquinone biosynthesis C-methylase UbiE